MRKDFKKCIIIFIVFSVVLLASCSNTQGTKTVNKDVVQSGGDTITIIGLQEGGIKVPVDEIKALEKVTKDVISISSSGEENEMNVTGGLLEELLQKHKVSLKDLEGLRFVATDGYSIDIPKDIVQSRDIILAYEIDGEPLHEESKPIRTIIPDERAMYWVSQLSEIQLIGTSKSSESKEESTLSNLIFLDSAITALETVNYGETDDKAIKTADLLDKYGQEKGGEVFIKASDDFEKSESNQVFSEAFIKITGENTPMLGAPDMPKGMTVKDLLWFSVGDTAFLSVEKALQVSNLIKGDGVSLGLVLEDTGLSGETYELTALDGYSVEVSSDDVSQGIINKGDDGIISISFPNLDKGSSVKDLLSIKIK